MRPSAGTLALDGGDPELTVAEQAHYLGHQDALKPALSVTENLDFWVRFLGGRSMDLTATLAEVGLAEEQVLAVVVALPQRPAPRRQAAQGRKSNVASLLSPARLKRLARSRIRQNAGWLPRILANAVTGQLHSPRWTQ